MKIVYLIHSLHNAGGMERILTSKANWLCRQPSIEIYIITSHQRNRKIFFELDPSVKLLDVGVNERLRGGEYVSRLHSFLNDIRPDVTISMCGSDIFHLTKCDNAGKKVAEYHFLHNKFLLKYPHRPLSSRIRTRKFEEALENYDAVVVLSRYDLDYYRTKLSHPERIFNIGNIVQEVTGPLSELSEKRFICVGRLSPEKQFDYAIRIWKEVLLRHPDWRLDIYGNGEEQRKLHKLISSEGLSASIALKGSSQSIGEEYMNSSGLLVTSRYEGFSLVVMEAASYGVPVVAYSCPGGLVELVDDGENGYLLNQGDIRGASDRICTMIEDVALRRAMGMKAHEKSKGYFRDAIMHQWLKLFDNLAKAQ